MSSLEPMLLQDQTSELLFFQFHREALVEIIRAYIRQFRNLVLKEVIGIRHHFMVDLDALLGFQLGDKSVDGISRGDGVVLAIDEQA